MADNKNKREPFHWNFDLKNTDSDFTDIEYSPEEINTPDKEDDIKPFIFVDGKYNSDTDASSFADNDVWNPSAKTGSRSDYDEEDDFEEDYGKKEKKKAAGKSSFFGNNDIPWKKIGIIAGAVLLVVLAVILLWPKKDKDPVEKKWTENTDVNVKNLVENYFIALKEGDKNLMSNVMVSGTEIDPVSLLYQSKIYDSFTNTKIYTYPGMNEGEQCLVTLTDMKFVNIDTPAPKCYFFYAKPEGDNKTLRLKELSRGDENTEEYKYFAESYGTDQNLMGTVNKANDAYQEALNNDAKLKKYVELYNNGIYDVAEAGTLPPASTPNQPVGPGSSEAPQTDPSVPDNTPAEGERQPSNQFGYISDWWIRLRSDPSTASTDNVLIHLEKYHYVLIVGELDGWYHIKDILEEDGVGGTQTCSGLEGYVSSDYLTPYYNLIPND